MKSPDVYKAHFRFPKEVKRIIEPPEDITISEWTENFRVLSFPSEEKGPLRLARTPYLRDILDAPLDPFLEEIDFCKASQIGGSEGMFSVLGYYAVREPCSIMYIMADEDTAIYKIFQTSELEYLIQPEYFGQKEIRLLNGTYIAMGWASSVAKLASRPMRIIFLDEIDKPGYYRVTSREASPISLAIQRTETFYNRKIFLLSTPTTPEGNIWKQQKTADALYDFHVPCPYCGLMQPLRWSKEYASGFPDYEFRGIDGEKHPLGQVVWKGGRKATARQIQEAGYQCGKCKNIWNTVEKNLAVQKGRMVARAKAPKHPRKIWVHVSRLYSMLGKSGDFPQLVDTWLRSFQDPLERQGFVNGALAEPWKQTILSVSETHVLNARCELPAQQVPESAVALTCGIDVQKYGFWYVIRAWAADYTSWLIAYGFLAIWADVEKLLFESRFPRHGGKKKESVPIWRAGIDIGGSTAEGRQSMTEETELWLIENHVGRGCRVWGTKGSATPLAGVLKAGKPLIQTPSGKPLRGGLQIISLDTNKLKDIYHYHLDLAIKGEPRGAYLHKETDNVYANQILAEEKRRDRKGQESWVKTKKDNHLLDCEVIAFACAHWEWPGGGINLISTEPGKVRRRRIISKGIGR